MPKVRKEATQPHWPCSLWLSLIHSDTSRQGQLDLEVIPSFSVPAYCFVRLGEADASCSGQWPRGKVSPRWLICPSEGQYRGVHRTDNMHTHLQQKVLWMLVTGRRPISEKIVNKIKIKINWIELRLNWNAFQTQIHFPSQSWFSCVLNTVCTQKLSKGNWCGRIWPHSRVFVQC